MSSPPAPTSNAMASLYRGAAANRLLIVGLLLAGFALRLFRLGAESLWYDETVSVYLAAQPIQEILAHTARDIHPPAYYLLLHAWRMVSQPTIAFGLEYLYAWPNLWLSLVVLALTYAIGNRLFGPGAALWALALATIHPTQFWFTQEVRMYALGACCLMLTLWSVTPLLLDPAENAPGHDRLPRVTQWLYPIAALLGLYTLYYFLFWLLPFNAGIVIRLWPRQRLLRHWLLLQCLVVIGWLPWFPIFLRQATDPPVPPWRTRWQSATEALSAFSEAIAALWNAHAFPLDTTWVWAILIVGLAAVNFVYAKSSVQVRVLWLLFAFGPVLLLFFISLTGLPLYHVRYVSTYAPVFVLLIAAYFTTQPRIFALGTGLVLLALSTLSIRQFLTDPRFAADDHRAAVAMLAQQWRPGDALVANAGWVYPAISIYWPHELDAPHATRPPAIAAIARLTPEQVATAASHLDKPSLLRTGSIDGESSLGWNLPESDFFAVSAEETKEALTTLAQHASRIWHYRLYDTVSDPQGVLRQWLTGNTAQTFAQSIPGRDFLQVEAYNTAIPPVLPRGDVALAQVLDAQLRLADAAAPPSSPAGEIIYVKAIWQAGIATDPTQVALSLRLLDSRGYLVSQQDTALQLGDTPNSVQWLALPIPADTMPGIYTLGLVIYSPITLTPYPLSLPDGLIQESPLSLGDLSVTLPQEVPRSGHALASFDYIDLIQSSIPATPLAPGSAFPLELTWRPRASAYRDHYRARLSLVDTQGRQVTLSEFDLGANEYPSSRWPAGFPLRQREIMQVPATLEDGDYVLQLAVVRATDGQRISARLPWRLVKEEIVELGVLGVQAAQ